LLDDTDILIMIYENDDVKEAVVYNDRMFCIRTALDLTMRQQILLKEQWTKYEEDKFYLELYLKEHLLLVFLIETILIGIR
uniref:Cytochrome b-c1 complex subunit 7 n=1 Tax=Ursus maritimus TaxID=29073 RepID=A0A452VEM5_URSMA